MTSHPSKRPTVRAFTHALAVLVCLCAQSASAGIRTETVRWIPQGAIAADGYELHIRTDGLPWQSLDLGFVPVDGDGIASISIPFNDAIEIELAVTAYVLDGSDKLGSPYSNTQVLEAIASPECLGAADCSDGDVCNGIEQCVAGVCEAGADLVCPAPGPCQAALCDAEDGCMLVEDLTDPACNEPPPPPDPDPVPDPDPDPVPDPTPENDEVSVSVSGGQYLDVAQAQALGIADDFSISVWTHSASTSGARKILEIIEAPSSSRNRISITARNDLPGDPIQVLLWDENGNLIHDRDYEQVHFPGEWTHFVLVKNGRSLALYANGVLASPSRVEVDRDGAMSNRPRIVILGAARDRDDNFWHGGFGHVGVWDRALQAGEVDELAVMGHALDLRTNSGSYASAGRLRHYWKPGALVSGIGRDFVDVASIDLRTPGIGAAQIVADAPLPIGDPPPGPPPIDPSLENDDVSVSVSGGQYLDVSQAQALGFGEEFSISIWLHAASTGGARKILEVIEAPSSSRNRISITARNDLPGDPIQVLVWDENADLIHFREYDRLQTVGEWMHLVLVRNGAGIALYANGSPVAPSWVDVDRDGPMSDRPRMVILGAARDRDDNFWDGGFGHVAVWDRLLQASEVFELARMGHALDLRADSGLYGSSGRLLHYWKPGALAAEIGRDFVDVAPVDLRAAGIGPSQIVSDAPMPIE